MDQLKLSASSSVDAFVAVGANIAPKRHIERALKGLMALSEVVDTSTFYLTEPEGARTQPRFVNGVWHIRAKIPPRALKYEILRKTERDLGRQRSADKHAPRVIDLDLLLYGDEVIDEPDLAIPDSGIYTRPFVAVPLAELAPSLVLPDTKRRVADLQSAKKREGLEALKEFTDRLKRCIRDERTTRK